MAIMIVLPERRGIGTIILARTNEDKPVMAPANAPRVSAIIDLVANLLGR
jgi:hypothetical protein